jgi:putative transcriptional regulator
LKKKLFKELLDSVKQGGAMMKGTIKPLRTFTFPDSEVRKIREKYGLSQDKFATLMGISVATLRNWEQGRRKPEGPARVLLRIAATHPNALLNIIAEASREKLEKERFLKTLEETHGAWTDQNHPKLRTKKDMERYVRENLIKR